MIALAVAFLWGLAEATLFFIVPDVAVSFIALRDPRTGLWAAAAALLGALCGGMLMYLWGRRAPEQAERAVSRVPAIPQEDMAHVRQALENDGLRALFFGPLRGIPYKIYAIYAHRHATLGEFLLISVPARGIRFFLAAWLTPLAARLILPHGSFSQRAWGLLIFWVLLYAVYFPLKHRRRA